MSHRMVENESPHCAEPLMVTVRPHGMAVTHDMPCPIYGCDNSAVVTLDDKPSVFQPCWGCQEKGYKTVRLIGWKARLVAWLTGGD